MSIRGALLNRHGHSALAGGFADGQHHGHGASRAHC
jgi:hypothetical protein